MSQYIFGSGTLTGTPTSDAFGNAIALPTPVKFGALQDVSVDFSFDTKMLYGANQFPIAIGRGKGKISGKASFAQINGTLWNSLMFGQTLATGQIADVVDTTGILVPATPFTVTAATTVTTPLTQVQIPGTGTWVADLGVTTVANVPLIRVASAPITGQYSVAAGVYLFAAADVGTRVYINFQYSTTNTAARTGTVNNVQMGYAPTFQADLVMPYNGKFLTLSLPNCLSTKLGLATKLDDFSMPSFEFEGFANGNGSVFTFSMSDA